MTVPDHAHLTYPRIAASGDRAVVVELSDQICDETNRRVVALAAALDADPIDGIVETVPTYRSLLVCYDPLIVRGRDLSIRLLERLSTIRIDAAGSRRLVVPVLYGGDAGMDLSELAEMKDMSVRDLVALHGSADYRVHMIGFAPGFAYLGGLPEKLHTPRLPAPRQRIEASVIGIGGKQASINSVPGPSGWRFIGRTPIRVFDPARKDPFLLRAGDHVRFRAIEADEAAALDAAVADGAPPIEWEEA
ncbi:KipI family sensor histidine kinase inhibitor [Neorhizobium galegae]|uniref:5-oxoprolinase subunit PxpB n=1 Tax=Neorhizobium galegae TaxID=399 RepID=UPI001AE762D1|nr:5-oxoprolinase subunit PxpB [Neorhizobium galegae]MBP2550681.1 KipI family sensor histidine kinase inhibitor [Neorhizobium galegae]